MMKRLYTNGKADFTRRSQGRALPHLWQRYSVQSYAYLLYIVKDA